MHINEKQIKTKYKQIDKIHHISDIQVRLIKRHKEYSTVFKNLYDIIEKDKENSMIVVSGDIIHTKTELSPELLNLTAQFLDNLGKITTTLVIAGNHDCNLNNKARLDSLYPIISLLKNDNLYYAKDSGIYTAADIDFSVMSIFDDGDLYVKAKQIKSDRKKIAVYHGTVLNSMTDLGHSLIEGDVDLDYFDGFDAVLLGDIHKTQRLQKRGKGKPEVWYSGSLIQQNHGEGLVKGMLTWDTKTLKPKFVNVPNDYGYYTIFIRNGICETDLSNLPKRPRLRVKISNTDDADVHSILSTIRQKAYVQEVVVNTENSDRAFDGAKSRLILADLKNTSVQNGLIVDYLWNEPDMTEDIIERVKVVNESVNRNVSMEEANAGAVWKLKRFEFENMFSYGKNNYIDFSKLRGTVGIFAPNASGKSAILDSISFCLFDKSPRAFKASNIMNKRTTDFKCELGFELDDAEYNISRVASNRKYTNQTKVDVNFWHVNEFDEESPLNGEDRDDTNRVIRSHIGTYDDFVLTAMSAQRSNDGFIGKGQTARKEVLSRFLGLTIFEQLYQEGNKQFNEIETLISKLQETDWGEALSDGKERYKIYSELHSELTETVDEYETKRDTVSNQLVDVRSSIVVVDSDVIDIDALNVRRDKLESSIQEKQTEVTTFIDELHKNEKEHLELETKIETLGDEDDIQDGYDELCRIEHQVDRVRNKVETLKIDINHKISKLQKLKRHEYDPNCKFCMNNVFVKDARDTQNQLNDDKTVFASVVEELESLSTDVNKHEHYRKMHNTLRSLKERLSSQSDVVLECKDDVRRESEIIRGFSRDLDSVDEKIKRHYEIEEVLIKNKKLQERATELKTDLSEIDNQLDALHDKSKDAYSNMMVAKNDVERVESTIRQLKEMEEQHSAYEYYLKSIHRDGIPYEMIMKIIPEIEVEVNNILSPMVDFSIKWELDGKNINVYIQYDEDKLWPLDLTSGMERFVSSIAIRTALLEISNLPRPNFLAIDEGFGVLDPDNLNSVSTLIDYLNTKFDFILLITHLDSLKDVVDSVIEVKKDSQEFSYVRVE